MVREMKDSGIEWVGNIPLTWKSIRNKYIMAKRKCIQAVYKGEDILSLTMNGVVVRDLDAGGKMPTSFDGYQKIQPGNLLMCLFDYDVTPRCIGLIKNEGLTSPAYSQFIMISDNSAEYFYYYYLMVDEGKYILPLAKNLRHSFTEEQLGAINVPLPSPSVQRLIADILDSKCSEIDSLIDDITKEIELLKEYRTSIINETMNNKEFPRVRFKYCATVKSNLVPPEKYSDYPQISPENIEKDTGRLIYDSVSSVEESGVISGNHLFHKGQIVYSKIRPTLNKAIIATFDGLCSADMYPIETTNDLNYILYSILSSDFVMQVKTITENRVKMPKINQEELGNIIVCLPDINKQHEVSLYLDSKCSKIDSLIASKQEQIDTLKEYKKSLIYEYVTGKKEVPTA